MRTLVLTLFAFLLLFSCGKDDATGSKAAFIYGGDGSEWDRDAVPGSPRQRKPTFSTQARPLIEQVASLSPTVYYTPKFNVDTARDSGCKLVGIGEWSICESSFRDCLMQGSCFLGFANNWRYFVRAGKAEALRPESQGRCRFANGYGGCLTPNVSIAADLNVHKVGDVIYVPELDGKNVPYVGRHDGFFVVHDKGGAIVGPNRFDFYTGHMGARDQSNAMARWGFGDKSRSFRYVKLGEAAAIAVRREKGL